MCAYTDAQWQSYEDQLTQADKDAIDAQVRTWWVTQKQRMRWGYLAASPVHRKRGPTKVCRACRKARPRTEFYKGSGADGLKARCRYCVRIEKSVGKR